jgi:hypothetical protein
MLQFHDPSPVGRVYDYYCCASASSRVEPGRVRFRGVVGFGADLFSQADRLGQIFEDLLSRLSLACDPLVHVDRGPAAVIFLDQPDPVAPTHVYRYLTLPDNGLT